MSTAATTRAPSPTKPVPKPDDAASDVDGKSSLRRQLRDASFAEGEAKLRPGGDGGGQQKGGVGDFFRGVGRGIGNAASRAGDAIGDTVYDMGTLLRDHPEALATGGAPHGAERSLSSDELIRAVEIYDGAIDLTVVKLNKGSFASLGSSRTIANTVYLTEDKFLPGRGVPGLTPQGMSFLMHELCHVWQYQNAGLSFIPRALAAQAASGNAYDWRAYVAAKTPFDQWNPEAQADVAFDYNESLQAIRANEGTPTDYTTITNATPYLELIRSGRAHAGSGSKPPPGSHAGQAGTALPETPESERAPVPEPLDATSALRRMTGL